ncbi:hypothetical protein CTRI78_v009948 [Colletotrichum trifolii]|uniref:Uncharacterized protein n=1 Tax=Colletotrichum trifolii TaxID=5466 RepID=A0A4R8QWY3_COLTR|nr:hypothetical protein CTRI78_v009948 [Colletotrichum trifolii]
MVGRDHPARRPLAFLQIDGSGPSTGPFTVRAAGPLHSGHMGTGTRKGRPGMKNSEPTCLVLHYMPSTTTLWRYSQEIDSGSLSAA